MTATLFCLHVHINNWSGGPILILSVAISETAEKGAKIQAAQSDQNIYDPGKPGQIAKQKGNQVKFEQSYQSPVNSAYDCQYQCSIIQTFHIVLLNLLFLFLFPLFP